MEGNFVKLIYISIFSEGLIKFQVPVDRHARILSCNFTDLFIDGMKLLSDVENNDGNLEKLQLHERNAMLRLYDFFKNLGERVRLGLSNDNVGLSQPFLGQDNGRFFGWGGGSRILRIYHFLSYRKGLIVGPYSRVVTTLS